VFGGRTSLSTQDGRAGLLRPRPATALRSPRPHGRCRARGVASSRRGSEGLPYLVHPGRWSRSTSRAAWRPRRRRSGRPPEIVLPLTGRLRCRRLRPERRQPAPRDRRLSHRRRRHGRPRLRRAQTRVWLRHDEDRARRGADRRGKRSAQIGCRPSRPRTRQFVQGIECQEVDPVHGRRRDSAPSARNVLRDQTRNLPSRRDASAASLRCARALPIGAVSSTTRRRRRRQRRQ
jgi:hypothetical protein